MVHKVTNRVLVVK